MPNRYSDLQRICETFGVDILYARDEDDADEYDLYVLRRAGDLAPLERERIALILGEAVDC
jgi:hypothetical protein